MKSLVALLLFILTNLTYGGLRNVNWKMEPDDSDLPSNAPSDLPSNVRSNAPSNMTSNLPSNVPSNVPSDLPSSLGSSIVEGGSHEDTQFREKQDGNTFYQSGSIKRKEKNAITRTMNIDKTKNEQQQLPHLQPQPQLQHDKEKDDDVVATSLHTKHLNDDKKNLLFSTNNENGKTRYQNIVRKPSHGKNSNTSRIQSLQTQSGDISITKGNKINTIATTPNDFVLFFKLYPHASVKNWSNIIRFTTTSNNCCSYGDRWLAMFFHPNSLKMHLVAGSTSIGNLALDADGVVANTWNDIKVEAIGDFIILHINGANKGQLPNTNRPQKNTVNVYAGDVFHGSANAIIRHYVYSSAV